MPRTIYTGPTPPPDASSNGVRWSPDTAPICALSRWDPPCPMNVLQALDDVCDLLTGRQHHILTVPSNTRGTLNDPLKIPLNMKTPTRIYKSVQLAGLPEETALWARLLTLLKDDEEIPDFSIQALKRYNWKRIAGRYNLHVYNNRGTDPSLFGGLSLLANVIIKWPKDLPEHWLYSRDNMCSAENMTWGSRESSPPHRMKKYYYAFINSCITVHIKDEIPSTKRDLVSRRDLIVEAVGGDMVNLSDFARRSITV